MKNKVKLRKLDMDDVDDRYSWSLDKDVTAYLNVPDEYPPFTREDTESWIKDCIEGANGYFQMAVLAEDDTHIGWVDLKNFDHKNLNAELGITIGDKNYWGKGYGEAALKAILSIGFTEMKLNKIWLRVDFDNERAVRCYEKCGFVKEGLMRRDRMRRGTLVDRYEMSMLKEEFEKMQLFDELLGDAQGDFSGWDFSYFNITGRMMEFPLEWNYSSKVIPHLKSAGSLLDMGTGGGEFLRTLHPLPECTFATESYAPNVEIAKRNLEPAGVKVIQTDDDNNLPFEDEMFDLVINRHESFSPFEVKRMLKDDGVFITQQVGGLNDREINEMLGADKSEYYNWNLEACENYLANAGMKILDKGEEISRTRFYDVGALAYYLKVIPWQIPDFSVEKYKDGLRKIHDVILEKGYIDVTCHRFFIVCMKWEVTIS